MSIELPKTERLLSEWERLEKEWIDTFPLGQTAPPYSDDELTEAFKRWGTPLSGRNYVWDARAHSPTRKPQSRVGNVITHVYSFKTNRYWPTESLHPEYCAVVRYEYNGAVREYHCQPPQTKILQKVRWKTIDGSTRESLRRIPYTPDILLLSNIGIYIDEWKTESGLLHISSRHPDRIFKLNGTWHYPEREAHFREMGIVFRLRSDEENSPILVQNLSFLSEYILDDSPFRKDAWEAISAITSKLAPMSLAALAERAILHMGTYTEPPSMDTLPGTFCIEDLYKAIAQGRLFVDLEVDDILEKSDVIVCASRAQLAWVKWHRPVPHSVSDELVFDLDIGTQFNFDGKTEIFTVCGVSSDVVVYTSPNSLSFTMAIDEFEKNIYRRHIQLQGSIKSTNQILAEIEHVDDRRIQKAWDLHQLLERIEAGLPVSTHYSKRQIQRLLKKKRCAGESAYLQVRALVDQKPTGGRCQIYDYQLKTIEDVARATNNSTNPKDKHSYKLYVELSAERGQKCVSAKTFYPRFREYKDTRLREGPRIVYSEAPAIAYLHRQDRIHGGWPFHFVHIDHTQLDDFVDVEIVGGGIRTIRPWLSIALEATSRPVVSFYLSGHSPSAISCMMIMRDMVRRYCRRPDMAIVDNGNEFLSHAFMSLVKRLKMDLRQRPPHEARFGTVCERIFERTNTDIIHNIVGNAKALAHVRTVTKSVDPLRADHLSFAQLHGLLEYYFFFDYNKSPHPAHGCSPDMHMQMQFRELGFRQKTYVPFDLEFYIATCIPPFTRGLTRCIDNKNGVLANYTYYWSDEFKDPSLNGLPVPVLIDMWNPCIAWAAINGRWVRCVSKFLMQFRRLTSVELKYLTYRVIRTLKTCSEDESFETLFEDEANALESFSNAAAVTAATRHIYDEAGLTFSLLSNVCDANQLNLALPTARGNERRELIRMNAGSGGISEQSPFFDFSYDELPISIPIIGEDNN